MMKRNQKKCTLYFRSTDHIEFSIYPPSDSMHRIDDLTIYDVVLDIDCVNLITVNITSKHKDANMTLTRVNLNGVDITDINAISYLQTLDGKIQKNYGYIGELGKFFIKLHTNAVSQNYLNYLLSLTR